MSCSTARGRRPSPDAFIHARRRFLGGSLQTVMLRLAHGRIPPWLDSSHKQPRPTLNGGPHLQGNGEAPPWGCRWMREPGADRWAGLARAAARMGCIGSPGSPLARIGQACAAPQPESAMDAPRRRVPGRLAGETRLRTLRQRISPCEHVCNVPSRRQTAVRERRGGSYSMNSPLWACGCYFARCLLSRRAHAQLYRASPLTRVLFPTSYFRRPRIGPPAALAISTLARQAGPECGAEGRMTIAAATSGEHAHCVYLQSSGLGTRERRGNMDIFFT